LLKYKEKDFTQIKKFNYLAAISFIFTAILLLNFSFTNELIFISNSLLISNNIIVLIKIILLITSAIIICLPNKINKYEFSLLIILANLGMMLLISSNDLIILYLAIELISLSLYTLATINRNREFSTEAGLKYFLLGALTSGFLLIGMTLLYYQTGDTNLTNIANFI
jgi:NADH-quinone oxidoreductase subunit N